MTVDLFGYKTSQFIPEVKEYVAPRASCPWQGKRTSACSSEADASGNAEINDYDKRGENMKKRLIAAMIAAAPLAAQATDGYFSHGYGCVRAAWGVGWRLALEPFGGAIHPATAGFLGNVWQVGLTYFSPDRSSERVGSGPAGLDGFGAQRQPRLRIPEFG